MDWSRLDVTVALCRFCPNYYEISEKPTGYIEPMPGWKIPVVPTHTLCSKCDLPLDVQEGDCAIDECKTALSFMREHAKKGFVRNTYKYMKREALPLMTPGQQQQYLALMKDGKSEPDARRKVLNPVIKKGRMTLQGHKVFASDRDL